MSLRDLGDLILSLIVFSAIPITFWLSHRFRDLEDGARNGREDRVHFERPRAKGPVAH